MFLADFFIDLVHVDSEEDLVNSQTFFNAHRKSQINQIEDDTKVRENRDENAKIIATGNKRVGQFEQTIILTKRAFTNYHRQPITGKVQLTQASKSTMIVLSHVKVS